VQRRSQCLNRNAQADRGRASVPRALRPLSQ
jgi:hypothetical protein